MSCRLKVSMFAALLVIVGLPSLFQLGVRCQQSLIVAPDDYPSIQEAINNASAGTTIFVKPGRYNESVVVNKPIRLIGVGNSTTIIYGKKGSTSTIEIRSNNVLIANFTITSPSAEPISNGILLYRASNVRVENNTILNHKNGLHLRYSSNNLLLNNYVSNNTVGIHIYDSSNNTLKFNRMVCNKINLRVWGSPIEHFLHKIDATNQVDGKNVYYLVNKRNITISSDAGCIYLVNCSNITVYKVNITNCFSGILLAYTHDCFIWDSYFSNNERGIYLLASHRNFVIGNYLKANFWSGCSLIASAGNIIAANNIERNKYGFYLSVGTYISGNGLLSSDQNIIAGNNVRMNLYGLFSDNATENVIRNNNFFNNSIAVHLSYSYKNNITENNLLNNQLGIKIEDSTSNLIFKNNFIENKVYVNLSGRSTVNYWNNGKIGNYWDNHQSVDEDRDGILDSPLTISDGNIDRHPLASAFMEAAFSDSYNLLILPEKVRVYENITFSIIPQTPVMLVWYELWDSTLVFKGNFSCKFENEGCYPMSIYVLNGNGVVEFTTISVTVNKFGTELLTHYANKCALGENVEIRAFLMDEDGNPLPGMNIELILLEDTLGVYVETIKTDNNGTAIFHISPPKKGVLQIILRFKGDSKYYSSISPIFISVSEPSSFDFIKLILGFMLAATVIFSVLFLRKIKGRRCRDIK